MKTKITVLFFVCITLQMFGNTVIINYGDKTTVRKNGFIYETMAYEKDSLLLDESRFSQIPFYRITGHGTATAIRAADSIPTEKALEAYTTGNSVILHESKQHFPNQLSSWYGFKHAMKTTTSYGYYDKSCNCIQSFQKHEPGWDRNWASMIIATLLFFYGVFSAIYMNDIWGSEPVKFLVGRVLFVASSIAITGGLFVYCIYMDKSIGPNIFMGVIAAIAIFILIKWLFHYGFKNIDHFPIWLNRTVVLLPIFFGAAVIQLQSSVIVQALIWSVGPYLISSIIMAIIGIGIVLITNKTKKKKSPISVL